MPAPPLLEFIVIGTPVSLQAKTAAKRAWRERVKGRAEAAWVAPKLFIDVCCSIGSYHDNPSLPDVDNIIKPIQDALEGVVYDNDNQVADTLSYKRDLTGPIRFVWSPRLRLALATGLEFVHIQVSSAAAPHYVRL